MNKKKIYVLLWGLILCVVIGLFVTVYKSQNRNRRLTDKLPSQFKGLQIKRVEHNGSFKLSKKLKYTLEYMMLVRDTFNSDKLDKKWEEDFFNGFVRCSEASCKYLDDLIEKNSNNWVKGKDINYVHFSLTGKMNKNISESGVWEACIYGHYSEHSYYRILDYKVSSEIDNIKLTVKYGKYKIQGEGKAPYEKGVCVFDIIKNPYSCFDGYSIRKMCKKNKSLCASKNKIYIGECSYDEDTDLMGVEYAPDEVLNNPWMKIDFSDFPDLKEYAYKHKNQKLMIEYRLKEVKEWVTEVIPVRIQIKE